jgi:hypothetical protein
MAEHEREPPSKQPEIELAQELIESFARFIVPDLRKYYEIEQGQREFKEWEERQNQTKKQDKKKRGPRLKTLTLVFCFNITATPLRQSRL